MDEELKSIQSDLDDVLGRLAAYMSGEKLPTQGVEWDGATVEDAASVIFSYSGANCKAAFPMNLDKEIAIFRLSRAEEGRLEAEYLASYGEKVGVLVAAISALSNPSTMPDTHHISVLRIAANNFIEGSSKWFGQSQGLPLVRSRNKKGGELENPPLVIGGYLDKDRHKKWMAVQEVYYRSKEVGDPKDDGLFEEVAKGFGLKKSALKAAYYSECEKTSRMIHEELEEHLGRKLSIFRRE
ncbi:MAG: hypothetical protein ACQEXO_08780 [Pseudomonadota bacterium]